MTSRLSKRPADQHVTHATMTTGSEHVVARVGKSPSEFHDSPYYYYGDSDYAYGQCIYLFTCAQDYFCRRLSVCVSVCLSVLVKTDKTTGQKVM